MKLNCEGEMNTVHRFGLSMQKNNPTKTVRTGQHYIFVGLQAIDSPIGSNCVNIAREISKHNKVLYVNYPLDQHALYKQLRKPEENTPIRMSVLKGKSPELHQLSDNLYALYPRIVINSISKLPDGKLYDRFNYRNNKRIAKKIKKYAGQLGFNNYYLFNDSDMFRSFYLKELLQPDLYVYYSRDNLISQPYFAKHGVRLEAELIEKVDLATANSLYLADYCRQFNPHSYYVGQGCETDLFDPQMDFERPQDLPATDKPVIGYIGALLKKRLDIGLLEYLAEAKPEWDFVYVGPEDEHFKNSKLHQQKNVLFTGPKQPAELPQYLKFFDVAINPQELNPLTVGNYPRKIDEYLAMGKPSVATQTRAMEIFKDHVYLGETREDYVNLIAQALAEDSTELQKARIKFAKQHTWEASVDEIHTAMEKVVQEKFS